MKTDFDAYSSAYGLKIGQFQKLKPKTKKRLLILISRIMERAYRRGVQQALEMKSRGVLFKKIEDNLAAYRYDLPLHTSYGLNGSRLSSLDRLRREEHLQEIGLSTLDSELEP